MKKFVILGLLALSLVGCDRDGHEHREGRHGDHGRGKKGMHYGGKFANLSEEQMKEMRAMKKEFKKANRVKRIELEELDIKFKRAMLEETPNAEALNQIIDAKTKIKSDMMKARYKNMMAMKEKFGLEDDMMPMRGRKGKHRDGQMMGKKDGHNGMGKGKNCKMMGGPKGQGHNMAKGQMMEQRKEMMNSEAGANMKNGKRKMAMMAKSQKFQEFMAKLPVEKQVQMKEMHKTFKKEIAGLKLNQKEAKLAIKKAKALGNADEATINGLIDNKAKAMANIKKAKIRHVLEMKKNFGEDFKGLNR